MDAKIAASEARTDAKFEAIRGDLRVIAASTQGLKGTVVLTGITSVLAVAALLLGVLAYGGDRFNSGLETGAAVERAADQAAARVILRQQLEEQSGRTGL